jgi:hypothetical protein
MVFVCGVEDPIPSAFQVPTVRCKTYLLSFWLRREATASIPLMKRQLANATSDRFLVRCAPQEMRI